MKKIAWIVIGIQLAAGAVLMLEAGSRSDKNMMLLFCLCLLSSHACLLGMWGAFSGWKLAWRLLAAAIGSVFLAEEFHWAAKELTPIASLLIAIGPVACLFALRSAGWTKARFVLFDCAALRTQTARPQFTIMQMLVLTTIVAVSTAIARSVSLTTHPMFRVPHAVADDYLIDMATFSLCAVPVALVCSWSLFSMHWSRRHWLAVLVVPLLTGLLPVLYREGPEAWIFVLVSFVQEAVLASALLPIRLLGYRLCPPAPRHRSLERLLRKATGGTANDQLSSSNRHSTDSRSDQPH